MFLRGYPKVGKVPTQQKGPTERGPKGLENFLVSGTIIVTLVTGTIPSVCTTKSGHAVPSHASPKAGASRKAGERPRKGKNEKRSWGGGGNNYGATRRHRTWETTMKPGSLLTKGGGGLNALKIPIHRVQDLENEWLKSASWRISHESYSLQQRPKSFEANK